MQKPLQYDIEGASLLYRQNVPRRLKLFRGSANRPADCFCLLHSLLDRRLCEKCALFHFLEDTRSFVLLLKPSQCAVDGFVFTYKNTDQEITSFIQDSIFSTTSCAISCATASAGIFSSNFRSPSFSKATTIEWTPFDVLSFRTTRPISSRSE